MNAPLRAVDCKVAPRVVVMAGPFEVARDIALDRPMTIAEALIAHEISDGDLRFKMPTVVALSGNPPEAPFELRGSWHVRVVQPGEVMTVAEMPGRGGSGGGKQIAGAIAMISLAIAAPHLAAGLGSAFAIGTTANSIASVAILTAGSLLINAVMPQSSQGPDLKAGDVYSVTAANNQADPLGPLPELFGELRYAPRFAARSFSEFSGNDQILYQVFFCSRGHIDISQIDVGNTAMWTSGGGISASFPDTQVEIAHPGDQITIFPSNVVTAPEVDGLQMDGPSGDMLGPFAVTAAGVTVNRVVLDFIWPRGIWWQNPNSGQWHQTFITVRADRRAIDASGNPVGNWVQLFSQRVAGLTQTPQRRSFGATVPEGRYEVRVYATDGGNLQPAHPNGANRPLWTGLKGYVGEFETPPNATLFAVRMKANDQLSQMSAAQFFITAKRRLKTWSTPGQTFSATPASTANPAWAAAYLLCDPDGGIGIEEHLVDLDWLAAYATTWASRGDEFNGLFDRPWTARDALAAILAVGRAQAIRLGGTISFVRDEPKQVQRAFFGPRDIVRGSASRDDILFGEDSPSHAIVEFIDRTDWQPNEVPAIISAVGEHEAQRIEKFGITDWDHAWREGIYEVASNTYRRNFRGFTTEWSGKLLTRGQPVLYHDPLMHGLAVAAVEGWDELTNVIEVDRDIEVEVDTEADLFAVIRTKRGLEWGPCEVASINGSTVTLDFVDRALVEADHGILNDVLPGERARQAQITLCEQEIRPFNGLVVSAIPRDAHRVDVLLVNDDPRVHEADQTEQTPSPWVPANMPPAVPQRPIIQGLTGTIRGSVAELVLEVGWLPAPGALSYEAEVSFDDGENWSPAFEGRANRFSKPIEPFGAVEEGVTEDDEGGEVEPPVVKVRVRGIGVFPGNWAEITIADVPDPAIMDGVVTRESLNAPLDAFMRQLDVHSEAALARRIEWLEHQFEHLSQNTNGLYAVLDAQDNSILIAVGQRVGQAEASIIEVREVLIDGDQAIATIVQQLLATNEHGTAAGNVQFTAMAAPDGVGSQYAMSVKAETEEEFSQAVMRIQAIVTELGGRSRIIFRSDELAIEDSEGNPLAIFEADEGRIGFTGDVVINGRLIADLLRPLTLEAGSYDQQHTFGSGNPLDIDVTLHEESIPNGIDDAVTMIFAGLRVAFARLSRVGSGTVNQFSWSVIVEFVSQTEGAVVVGQATDFTDEDPGTSGHVFFPQNIFVMVPAVLPPGEWSMRVRLLLVGVTGSGSVTIRFEMPTSGGALFPTV